MFSQNSSPVPTQNKSPLTGANTVPTGAPHNPAPTKQLTKDRKIRSKVYPKSEYAKKHPVTPQELAYARSENASYINKEHIRHQLDAVGNENRLKQLRARIASGEFRKSASVSSKGTSASSKNESQTSTYSASKRGSRTRRSHSSQYSDSSDES